MKENNPFYFSMTFCYLILYIVYVWLRVYFRNLQCQVPSHAEHYVETVENYSFLLYSVKNDGDLS